MGFQTAWHADMAIGTRNLAQSVTPSSIKSGERQLRMSEIQLRDISATPMDGITAIGSPTAGTIKNQGRAGLSQNRVRYPVK
jgi:hypothetical protein